MARGQITSEPRLISIPNIKLSDAVITIAGRTPLITCRFGEKSIEQIEQKQQKSAKMAKEARDPKQEFKSHLHIIDEAEGVYGFPAAGIKNALVAAGGRFADEKMTHLRGILNIGEDMVEIVSDAPKMRTDMTRLQSGVWSPAYRPEFMPWEMEVPVIYNEGLISLDQIVNLFQLAGFSVGIGSWRPENKGTFGQFIVKNAVEHSSATPVPQAA